MGNITKSQIEHIDRLVKDAGRNIIDAIEGIKEIRRTIDANHTKPGGDTNVTTKHQPIAKVSVNTHGMSKYAAKRARRIAEARAQELQRNKER